MGAPTCASKAIKIVVHEHLICRDISDSQRNMSENIAVVEVSVNTEKNDVSNDHHLKD